MLREEKGDNNFYLRLPYLGLLKLFIYRFSSWSLHWPFEAVHKLDLFDLKFYWFTKPKNERISYLKLVKNSDLEQALPINCNIEFLVMLSAF